VVTAQRHDKKRVMADQSLSSSKKRNEKGKQIKATDIIKNHWRTLTHNSWQGLTEEFIKLEQISRSEDFNKPSKAADAETNRLKNRYTNVLAADDTRVLIPTSDPSHSDYINANWIENQRYIAAQGPLEETVNDFWLMVWEHRVSIIAMLTREYENGNVKCASYWPASTTDYGIINVTQIKMVEEVKQVLHRSFQLTNLKTGHSRIVQHFQYTGWPDHGLPESPEAFIHLVTSISMPSDPPSPVVVHCSAGIGRTGTLCCVDIITQQLQRDYKDGLADKSVEFFQNLVFNTVLELRKQRAGMVQTKEQYYFCYLAVLALNCPPFRKALIKKKQELDELAEAQAREAALQAEAKEFAESYLG